MFLESRNHCLILPFQKFAMEDVLKGYFILEEWRPDLISDEVLNKLTPENMR